MRKAAVILSLTFVVSVFAGCNSPAGTNSSNVANANRPGDTSGAKTNVEELGVLVNVPYESEEAFWKEDAAHKKVIAVLRFPQGEANRLVEDASKIAPALSATISAETWFPPELIAQSGASGEDSLTGLSYPANVFYLEPYTDGRITRIENTDYFVLELTAK